MIPFFVVDRPISLEIIKGISIPSGKKIGLMAHANTSPNFRKAFRKFPSKQTVKMCDSAIFDAKRCNHETLFTRYQEMGADFGVMIDVLQDSAKTLENAKDALISYNPEIHKFKLVAVAQGHNLEEYLDCYEQLSQMGFEYIAVGGLLRRYETTARYVRVRDESLLEKVLTEIRSKHNPKWLFALGSFHPSRINLFKRVKVWGDYKGWIFNYKKRDEFLTNNVTKLTTNHLAHVPVAFTDSPLYKDLKDILSKREKQIKTNKKKHQELLKTKKQLKNLISSVHSILLEDNLKQAEQINPLKNRSILNNTQMTTLLKVIKDNKLSPQFSININRLTEQIIEIQKEYIKKSKKLEKYNNSLIKLLENVKDCSIADSDLKIMSNNIAQILSLSEQTHRISQVRSFIKNEILDKI